MNLLPTQQVTTFQSTLFMRFLLKVSLTCLILFSFSLYGFTQVLNFDPQPASKTDTVKMADSLESEAAK